MNRFYSIILTLALVPSFSAAQVAGIDYDWEEKRSKDGITLYTSAVEGSPFKAVRGTMNVKGSVKSLVGLVEDLAACPEWAAMCEEARVVTRVSDVESYVYVFNNVPFPVSDRDVYAHVVWSIDQDSGRVTMTSQAAPGGVDETKAVRLSEAFTQWHFTAQEDGTVLVENFAHINPNGPTPAWITNMLLVDAPYDSMFEMRKLIEGGAYENVQVSFLNVTQTGVPDSDPLAQDPLIPEVSIDQISESVPSEATVTN